MSTLEQCINAKLEWLDQRVADLEEKAGIQYELRNVELAEYFLGKMEGYRMAARWIRAAIDEANNV